MGMFSAYEGLEVEQVWIWWSLRLVFDVGPPGKLGTFIDITDFTIVEAGGHESRISVERDPRTAAPVLALLHHHISAARVEHWELQLAFDTGDRLICAPDPRVEAWTAHLPDGSWIFCPPGGGTGSPD
ncbi:DUF6188 family protein [Nocardia sp. CDC159]|uniref:DUF6188 family protein n=1 Tax=Nocardia pulmonis TaxID=2951408 RepID=A0A9X2E923_9NOCA|nr:MULTISPECIES: DUF6188 family protein [Nocardia]MCM6773743.1 DUF6188 family protein [Nocardia pulmonis]MCM6786630.1 DUF6188 family protein [Nocardia sp. CDC159]